MGYELRSLAVRVLFFSSVNCAVVALLVMIVPKNAAADEYVDFTNAKNAFEAGEYEEAINRFNELLESGLENPSLTLETHKLLGISYLFTRNLEAAETHFTILLTQSPDYSLDPLLYPIEVVDFFTAIKQKNQARFDQLAKAQAIEEKKRRIEEERRRKAEIEKLKRNVYLERERKQHSKLVAILPYGTGQFQNGQKLKAALFLSSELLLTVTAITSYALHSALRSIDHPDESELYEKKEKVYRITNHVSVGVLAGVMVAGIVDALYFFVPERVVWRKVKEEEVPNNLRPGSRQSTALFSITIGKGIFSAGIAGRF